jgi:RNA polymerase-binding transcription factor DksA
VHDRITTASSPTTGSIIPADDRRQGKPEENQMAQAVSQQTIDKLHALRDELAHRADAIDADVHHKNEPVEKDFAEQVTQRENDDVLNAIGGEATQTVRLIDIALKKIENGSYGICDVCGEEIPAARLNAIPYASTCVKCAE